MHENNSNKAWMGHPALRNLVVSLVALLVVFVAVKTIASIKALPYAGISNPSTNVITVNGKGEVVKAPDIATFSFGVTQEAQTVGDAQKKATDKMNALLDYVKQAGIEDKDVKTVSYNIYPRYEYQGTSLYYPNGRQYLAAYVVSQTVEVKVRDLTKAGEILSGVGSKGATDVSGLTFSFDQQDEIARQARDAAITDARSQAEVLAKALGVRLGHIVSYSESTPYQPYPVYYAKDMRAGAVSNESATPQLPTGENKVTSNVSVTYEIR